MENHRKCVKSGNLLLQTVQITTAILLLLVIRDCIGAQYDVPRAIVSEYYGNPYYENIRALGVPRNSEIIVGENTSKGILKLLFECSADYPVQWTYSGDGVPEITTDTNVNHNRGQINSIAPGDFSASLSIAKLTEGHTGNYTCKGIHDRNMLISFYLFVPGERIFTSAGGDNITYSTSNRDDTIVRIPCSVSHPEAHVTLQRARNGYLNCPLNESLSYSPKTGFTMRISDYHDPSGTYICTASYNNSFKLIQFQLLGRYEPFQAGSGSSGTSAFSSCFPSPCGQSAECRILHRRALCSCPAGFTGDPFLECRRSVVGGLGHNDPCHPSPCGRYGDCVIKHGLAACTCSPGFHGKPPHCTPATTNQNQSIRCIMSRDCPSSQPMCLDRLCTNPCDNTINRHQNRCGRKADCNLVNRTPICTCPQGYLGDAYQECYLSEEFLPKTPYAELEERLRPECQIDPECPHTLSCIHQKCQNPCPSACGPHNRNCQVQDHRAICNPTVLSSPNRNCHPADFNCNNNRNRLSADQQRPPNHPSPSPPIVCFGNSGCPTNRACHNRKCHDPCEDHSCGLNGKCVTSKHKAECQCLNGYFGDPKIRCTIVPGTLLEPISSKTDSDTRNNCFSDTGCGSFKACFNGQCQNPCEVFRDLCGNNQECKVVSHKSECTCRPGFPFRVNNDCFKELVSDDQPQKGNERSFDNNEGIRISVDPNSNSNSNSDEEGNNCEPPFCRQGDFQNEKHRCRFNADCSSQKTCINSVCTDMCSPEKRACGVNAECRMVNRAVKCSCPPGFFGSPKIRCYPLYRQIKDGNTGQEGGGQEIILLENGEANTSAEEGVIKDVESDALRVINSTNALAASEMTQDGKEMKKMIGALQNVTLLTISSNETIIS